MKESLMAVVRELPDRPKISWYYGVGRQLLIAEAHESRAEEVRHGEQCRKLRKKWKVGS